MKSISCINPENVHTSDIWLLPMQTGLFRRPGKPIRLTNGPLPYSFPCPSRDGKQIFALGTKQRGELVRYDMKSKQFVPFLRWDFCDRPDILPRWEMGRLCFLSGPHPVAQPQRWNRTHAADLSSDGREISRSFLPTERRSHFTPTKTKCLWSAWKAGQPQKIMPTMLLAASWSPDGNYLLITSASPPISLRSPTCAPGRTPLFLLRRKQQRWLLAEPG